jgi:CRISPR-associated protein Cst1
VGEQIVLRLNNFLYNAGVLGFIKVLKNMENDFVDVDYSIQGNTLTFSSDVFKDFTQYYLKTLMDEFEKDTMYYSIIEKYKMIVSQNSTEETEEFKDLLELMSSTLKANKFSSGYTIISKRGDKTDIKKLLDLLNKEKDFTQKQAYAKEIIDYMEKYRDVLLMKDIMYTKINLFWTNIAFLHKQSIEEEIDSCYEEKFIVPILQRIGKKPRKNTCQCIECGREVPILKEGTMSWINDMGVDINRKRSNFWNYNPDVLICPICKVIYSCVPLGFYIVGKNGLFINSSVSIESLIEMNNYDIKMSSLIDMENAAYYKILKALNYLGNVESARKQIDFNIQIVKRVFEDNQSYYKFNIVTPTILTVLSERQKEFQQLMNRYYTFNKGTNNAKTKNIYDTVITYILENKNLFSFMHDVLRDSIKSSQKIDFLYNVLKIQITFSMKGVVSLMERIEQTNKLEKTTYHIWKCGLEIKNILTPKNGSKVQGEGKVKSYIYKLLNALRTNNTSEFVNTVIKLYIDAKKEIPASFLKMLNDEEQFKILGNAFVMGLLGQESYNEENENNN